MRNALLAVIFVLIIVSGCAVEEPVQETNECRHIYDDVAVDDYSMDVMWSMDKPWPDMIGFYQEYFKENEAFWTDFLEVKNADYTKINESFCLEVEDCEMREWCIARLNTFHECYLGPGGYSANHCNWPPDTINKSYCLGNDWNTNACILNKLMIDVGITPTHNIHLYRCESITVDWMKKYCKHAYRRKE